MASLSLRGVGILTPDPLFQDLTLTLQDGDRLGLVAGNGAGKSTLLRCLAGQAEPGVGEITRSRGLRVALVEQDMPANLMDLPLHEAIRRTIPAAEREGRSWRVDVVLDEFNTPEAMYERPVRALSGGWQRLALIARAWVAEPDALLLDEPTNHLDLEKIEMLEGWINDPSRQMPMVIASHDRRFLDRCTNRTLFLRPGVSPFYAHPYTRARHLLAEDDTARQAQLDRDSKEVSRLRRSAGELKNIGINSRSDAAQKKSAQMARRAEVLEDRLQPVHSERAGEIRLANRGTHAKVMLTLEDVTVTAPDGTRLFRTGKLSIAQGERIVLLGPNGAGKSRLVGLLRQAMEGAELPGIRVSPTAVMGYMDQQMTQLPDRETPHAFIAKRFDLGDQKVRSLLASAGIAMDRQGRPIGQLSPGQKARLGLLALRLAEPNFYLLDEPTNHIDIAGQERLEEEILTQGATCVLVSHDRAFAQAVGTRFLAIAGGQLKDLAYPA
jgi:ATPase subunit of ABC transporter with duplicated ATPase domains